MKNRTQNQKVKARKSGRSAVQQSVVPDTFVVSYRIDGPIYAALAVNLKKARKKDPSATIHTVARDKTLCLLQREHAPGIAKSRLLQLN
jgi:hypothetical protein